jgi:hypothetical protein
MLHITRGADRGNCAQDVCICFRFLGHTAGACWDRLWCDSSAEQGPVQAMVCGGVGQSLSLRAKAWVEDPWAVSVAL